MTRSPLLLAFLAIYVAPVVLALLWRLAAGRVFPQVGDRSPAFLLPPPTDDLARVRIMFVRGRGLRFFLGGHSFIVYRRAADPFYTRWDYDALGEPIRAEGFIPNDPRFARHTFVWGSQGPAAEALIPQIEAAVQAYGARHHHDYRRSIGPNSNTFIQGIIDAVPGIDAMLPPNALGKEYPHDGAWLRRTTTGIHLTLGGLASLRIGWIEGIELSFLLALAGIDWRRPAIKLPALGRIGMPLCRVPGFVPGSGRLPIGDKRAGTRGDDDRIEASRGWQEGPVSRGRMGAGPRGRGRGLRVPR